MDENSSNFFNQIAAEYSKNPCQFLYIFSGRTIRKAEYDRIFKIIPSCARFREIAKIDALL